MEREMKYEIVNQAMANIREMFDVKIGFKANKKGSDSVWDGVLQLREEQFACVVMQKVQESVLNTLIRDCEQVKCETQLPVIVIALEISAKQMINLHECGIHTLDANGNCYVQHNTLMMLCQGRKGNQGMVKETLTFKEQGLKVLYFILSDLRHVNLPFRDIQTQTGVGLATINKLFSSLQQNGYLFTSKKGRHLKNTMALLSVFVDNYCRVVKPKQLMAVMRFVPEARSTWTDLKLPTGMVWGGEPGAYMADKYLLPGSYEIYSTVNTMQLVASKIAVPAKDGEIKVYGKFWPKDENSRTAPALIIYADLMGSGDSRCIEAAQRIFDHELSYLR